MSRHQNPPLVELQGVEKRFGGVRALRGVDLAIRPGSVIGIAGENGAGKSTLLKVLVGVHAPDRGRVFYRGREQRRLSPASAKRAGLAYVSQELSVFEHLSVQDNIILGQEPRRFGMIDRSRARALARNALARVGCPADVNDMVRDLDFANRQLVEIAKALVSEPDILVLDEPTSGLRETEVDHLLALMAELRRQDRSVIFITHRMNEFFAITDQLFIMRDGESVAMLKTSETNPDEVVSLMIGGRLAAFFPARSTRDPAAPDGDLLSVRNYSVPDTAVHGIDLDIRHGEVVGVAGLAGNGQTELLEGLSGIRKATGQLHMGNHHGPFRNVSQGLASGVALVPEDRKNQGLVLALSVASNVTLPHLKQFTRGWRIDRAAESAAVDDLVMAMQIRPSDPKVSAESLSGGNQQKVVIAKALLGGPRVYLFCDPTRGIDVKTKFEIYTLIRRLAAQGSSVILVSTDLAEITNLSDRVLVMSAGSIVAELTGDQITEHRITEASFQVVAP